MNRDAGCCFSRVPLNISGERSPYVFVSLIEGNLGAAADGSLSWAGCYLGPLVHRLGFLDIVIS